MKAGYDCVIVGGGAVGATLALALAQLRLTVLLIEKESVAKLLSRDNLNMRTLALSQASIRIYEQLGIWDLINPYVTPITQVRVTVKGQYGSSRLKLKQPESSQLGAVIGASDLETALYHQLNQVDNADYVDVIRPAVVGKSCFMTEKWHLTVESPNRNQEVRCDLLVAADGAQSSLRATQKIASEQKDYGHYGIVANVQISDFEPKTAIERFLPKGAIALLPWQNKFATLVWSANKRDIKIAMALEDVDFLKACQMQLGRRCAKLEKIGKRMCFPLQMQLASQQSSTRFLLLGNAAHSLHPIAAQGLNLSLRDIWQIRNQILKAQQNKEVRSFVLGSEACLNDYVRARQADQNKVIFATDKIARFMAGGPIPCQLRALGITLFDTFSPAKNLFTRLGMGL